MATTGYSNTPLAKKLGIKSGYTIRLVNEPYYYLDLFADMPKDIKIIKDKRSKKKFIHYFTKKLNHLEKDIIQLKTEIEPDGMIWISWPKKSSGMKTNVTETLIRSTALANGLVDIKVCSVDEIWSGLKFVIPLKEREKQKEKQKSRVSIINS